MSGSDESTLDIAINSTVATRRELVPAVTVLWHPDETRIGTTAFVSPGPLRIFRDTPFAFRDEPGTDSPLLHARELPRSKPDTGTAVPAVALEPHAGGVLLTAPRPGTPVKVAGEMITSRFLSSFDLAAGVVLYVAQTLVLCVHWARRQRPVVPSYDLVGHSDAIHDVRSEIRRIANLSSPVLLLGETGTGKGSVAAALLKAGPRARKPFQHLNTKGQPSSVLSAQLFGYERGAFTGAVASTQGLFQVLHTGTLFLDEIGRLDKDGQDSLLLVLDSGQVRPIGSTRPPTVVDVRVLAATDENLEVAITQERFLLALYQRLAANQIHLCPLRERREDFGVLFLHFLRSAAAEMGLAYPFTSKGWLPPTLVAKLAEYEWPGNVRELRDVAKAIVSRSQGEPTALLPVYLNLSRPSTSETSVLPPAGATYAPAPERPEDTTVTGDQARAAVIAARGNVSLAATNLGCSRAWIYRLVGKDFVDKLRKDGGN